MMLYRQSTEGYPPIGCDFTPNVVADRCRQLFLAVLYLALEDLCRVTRNGMVYQQNETYRARTAAERWVGSYMSKDFEQVCDLAGMEPTATWRTFRSVAMMEPEARNNWLRAQRMLDTRGRFVGNEPIEEPIKAAE